MSVKIQGKGPLRGEVSVPGDKSVSHRAVIFGALAEGRTEIEGFLFGEDCLSTVSCMRQLGAAVHVNGETVSVDGVGLTGLKEPENILDAGNSGTTARLLLGVLAGQPFYTVLTGDGSLRRRPMSRVTKPLLQMGAAISGRAGGTLLPLSVQGSHLTPTTYTSPVASAQVKSAVLLAGLFAEGETTVTEPEKSRDHTERMLAAFGAAVDVRGNSVTVTGRPKLQGRTVRVPGDISSAAFFLIAASIVPGSDLLVRNVGINPTRTGILDVLTEMGADMEYINTRDESGEPVADIRVKAAPLRGVEIGGEIIPRLIDELPVLAVAALFAKGETVVRDAAELRVKETDRIAAMTEELSSLGADIEARDDGFIIRGGRMLTGGSVKSHDDHRVAMSLCIAALGAGITVDLDSPDCIAISYPSFLETIKTLGSGLQEWDK
ncbi:MAG: 3-phosphoshikimate 1-carboxyvinyltransferase [Clostridiales bacterium]|jgi:3-phosphoshikimate 1-carboxyvinyltransferase|nr:3-phosphoshikimate 1-carboxyvinyltransferase [Clostridiales bacterium]